MWDFLSQLLACCSGWRTFDPGVGLRDPVLHGARAGQKLTLCELMACCIPLFSITLLLGCVSEFVCLYTRTHAHACMCMSTCAYTDIGGGAWVSCSVTLCFIPMRQGLFMNLGLGWWLTSSSDPLFSVSHSAGIIDSHIQPYLAFLRVYWRSEVVSSCWHSKCSYPLHNFLNWNLWI